MDFYSPRISAAWRRLCVAAAILAGLAGSAQAMGIGGQDMEKPKPVVTPVSDTLVAKLIPRGKSTSVQIAFAAEGGTLAGLRTADFDETSHQGVDPKNFNSGLFALEVAAPAPGAAVRLTMRSDFFTSGTAWFLFNPAGQPPWGNAGADSRDLGQRVWELALTVTDGGPLDSDGRADGHLTVIGGPRDSFWGYAIGTLFIRFFGIFIVLCLLMVGMFASGWIFGRIEARRAPPPPGAAPDETVAAPPAASAGPGPEAAAAVALALHLAMNRARLETGISPETGPTPWVIEGRMRMMNDRQQICRRAAGPGGHGGQH